MSDKRIDLNQIENENDWFTPSDPFQKEVSPVEYVVDKYCARGHITVIGGSGGSGKSLLNQYLLQVRDNDLLPANEGRALYLTDADTSENELRRRAHYFKRNSGLDSAQLPIDKLCMTQNAEFQSQIEYLVSSKDYDTVVFDTLADFHDGTLIEADKANESMKFFTQLARRANVAVILITHTRKGSKSKSKYDIEDISDSRVFTTKADFVFALKSEYQPDGSNLIELQCLKCRIDEAPPSLRATIFKDNTSGCLRIKPATDLFQSELAEQDKAQKREYLIEKALELKEKGLSNAQIGKQLGISKGTVHNYLKEGGAT